MKAHSRTRGSDAFGAGEETTTWSLLPLLVQSDGRGYSRPPNAHPLIDPEKHTTMSTIEDEQAAQRGGRFLGPYQVLQGNRDLSLLFGGQVVSAFGDWLYITALVVLTYNLTHSATTVAALTFVRLLPYALFLPIGGALADRFDRRKMMVIADLGRVVCMVGLLAVDSRERIWIAFPLVFISTCLFSVFRPALGATLPAVAGGEKNLVRANILMSQVDAMSLVLGPGLAGVLILLDQTRVAFALNACTYAVSAITLLSLRVIPRRERNPAIEQGWQTETLAGFRFLFRERRGALAAITLSTAGLTAFNGAIWTLAVVLSERTWHFGSQGTGFLNAFYGLGGLAGGFIAGIIMHRCRLMPSYIGSMIASAGAIILFGISPAGILPFMALALFGIGDVVNQVAGNTLIQQSTPDELLGRVFGAFESVIVGAILLGALGVAPLIGTIGPRASAALLGIVALMVLLGCQSRLRLVETPHTVDGGATISPMMAPTITGGEIRAGD